MSSKYSTVITNSSSAVVYLLNLVSILYCSTHKALGELAHLNPSHIGKIERAEMAPTLPTILSLLEALNIDFETLVKYK